jgi:hypothetical protein
MGPASRLGPYRPRLLHTMHELHRRESDGIRVRPAPMDAARAGLRIAVQVRACRSSSSREFGEDSHPVDEATVGRAGALAADPYAVELTAHTARLLSAPTAASISAMPIRSSVCARVLRSTQHRGN